MRTFIVLAAAVAIAFALDAVSWSGRQDGGVFTLAPAKLEVGTVLESGGEYTTLSLPGAGLAAEPGSPAVPVYRRLVEVPYGADVQLSVDLGRTETQQLALPVVPRQPPVPKTGAAPAFALDSKVYSTDAYSPKLGARLVEVGIMRGRRIAVVELSPVACNPVRNVVEYAPDMKVTVNWPGADWAKTRAMLRRYSSPPFTGRLEGIAVNEKQFRTNLGPSLPVGYLIIVPDAWQSNVAPLAEWRRRKGYNVFVRTLSQVGSGNKDTVRAYIKNAYDNWSIPPSFVLLVGDVDRIGFFTGSGDGSPPTDLDYSLCEGSDYWPDLDLSRASVASAAQLDSFVDKVVRYEQNSWKSGTEWLKKAYFVASADAGNHQIAENTHKYVMAKIRPMNTDCDSLWTYYNSGTPVDSAFKTGRAWVTFSGHGSEQGWSDPGITFHSDDVRALTNDDLIPYVQTYACICGNFASSSYPECFSETWIRLGRKGGIISMASSVTSYWTEDDTLERRVFDYMFDSSYTWVMGGFNKAKVKLYQQLGDNGTTRRYFEMYNCMGDGATDIYSLEPKPLAVTYPAAVPVGSYALQVTVASGSDPVSNALVCASAKSDTNAWASGYTNGSGQVTLNITTLAPDTVFVTVTGHNLAPHLGYCLALPPNGPYVMYLHHAVDDSGGGNNDSILNPGESVKIPMWVKNWGQQTANSVTAKLRTSDPNAQVTDSAKSFGDINSGDSAYTGPEGFGLQVNSGLGNGYTVVCSLCCRDALDSTWTSVMNLTVGVPILNRQAVTVVDTGHGGNRNCGIDPGETANLMVRLGNTGLGHGHNVHATLRSGDARLAVFDSAGSWGTVRRNDSASNAADLFTVQADASIPPETPVTCTLYCYADGGYSMTGTFTVIVGMPVGGIIWGPKPVPDMPSLPGISGVTYNTANNLIYCTYFGSSDIYRYSSDSLLIPHGPIAAPQDSCLDIDYTTYADAFWLVCNPQRIMYRLSRTGSVIRQFSLSFTSYPYGVTEFEDEHVLYISDRRNMPGQPQLIYVRDTLGNYAQGVITHPLDGPYGTRCLALDGRGSTHPPTLLNIWAWYNAAGTAIDSCGMYELDRTDGALLNGFVFPNKTWDVRGIEFDPRDGTYWLTIASDSTSKNMIVKVAGFNYGKTGVEEPGSQLLGPATRLEVLARPNPFTGRTMLSVQLPATGSIDLRIYDNSGRVVRTLARGCSIASTRALFTWDGKDDDGKAVAPGVYFYRLKSENATLTRKTIKVD